MLCVITGGKTHTANLNICTRLHYEKAAFLATVFSVLPFWYEEITAQMLCTACRADVSSRFLSVKAYIFSLAYRCYHVGNFASAGLLFCSHLANNDDE